MGSGTHLCLLLNLLHKHAVSERDDLADGGLRGRGEERGAVVREGPRGAGGEEARSARGKGAGGGR